MISDLIPDIASNAARSAHPDARAAHHNALSSAQLAATTSVDTAPSAHLERPDAHDKSNKYGEAYHRDPGVDVQAAERQFARFKHEVNHDRPAARASQDSSRLGRSPSKIPVHDVEKAASSTEDDDGDDDRDLFDLESEMRGSKQMEEEAGIKDKHIGVLWDGLTISGSGGVKTYVKVFPDAFVTFFNGKSSLHHGTWQCVMLMPTSLSNRKEHPRSKRPGPADRHPEELPGRRQTRRDVSGPWSAGERLYHCPQSPWQPALRLHQDRRPSSLWPL